MILNNSIHKKHFELWLKTSIFLIFLMILVGGLTRLTDSGLSITEWELFSGVLPPFGDQKWNEYFLLYKKTTQFTILNSNMTIDEFKVIYYWEYFHRLLGRIIGLMFILPLIFFSITKVIDNKMLIILYFIFFLICAQGLMGWYMVKSGLVVNTSVSHYRLSAHLFLAFIIISLLTWNYLNHINYKHKVFFNLKNIMTKILFFLIMFQIILGAFVSGLDAGLIYQTWPKMNLTYFPDDINIFQNSLIYLFNNQSFVQFLHRIVAYLIICFTFFMGIKMLINRETKFLKNYLLVFFILFLQVFLGILTLISGLNVYLASFHQITSVILVITVLNLNYKLS